jgi:transcriptional regulator with XRE-family HTH domain
MVMVGKERAVPTVEIDGWSLRRLREARMLSQGALAQMADMNVASVNRLEAGRRTMVYRNTVRKLAQALDVAPAELLKGDGDGDETGGQPDD